MTMQAKIALILKAGLIVATCFALVLGATVVVNYLAPTEVSQCATKYLTIGDLIDAINNSHLNSEVFYSEPE